jgi:hypothetical protein
MDKIYKKSEKVASREIENELVIVPVDDKKNTGKPVLFYLEDPTSIEIWKLIDGKRKLSQIIEETARLFNFERDKIKDDIVNFKNRWNSFKNQKYINSISILKAV